MLDAIDWHLMRATGGHAFRIGGTVFGYGTEDWYDTLGEITDPAGTLKKLETLPDFEGAEPLAARFVVAVLLED